MENKQNNQARRAELERKINDLNLQLENENRRICKLDQEKSRFNYLISNSDTNNRLNARYDFDKSLDPVYEVLGIKADELEELVRNKAKEFIDIEKAGRKPNKKDFDYFEESMAVLLGHADVPEETFYVCGNGHFLPARFTVSRNFDGNGGRKYGGRISRMFRDRKFTEYRYNSILKFVDYLKSDKKVDSEEIFVW